MSGYSLRRTQARQLRDQQQSLGNNTQATANHPRHQTGVAPPQIFAQRPIQPPVNPAQLTMTTYITNPFTGNINPGEEKGQKLYLKATAELKERLLVSQANAKDITTHFETDARNFAWGPVTNMIKVTATDTIGKSIITNPRDLKLEDVQKAAFKIWGDMTATYNTALPNNYTVQVLNDINNNDAQKTIFYLRVKSEMIAKRVENSITPSSWKTLMLRKKDFTWINTTTGEVHFDGATLLFILFSTINPSTRVGVSGLKLLISKATLAAFGHNVIDMLNDMASNYARILELGGSHEDYLLHLFAALLTTNNEIFQQFIQAEKNKWELGEDYLADTLIDKATTKYNNMTSGNQWKSNETKDAKIMALSTQLAALEKAFVSTKSSFTSKSDEDKTGVPGARNVQKWRTVKNKGEKCEVDGLTWWWCPKHKLEGSFDGLYVRHHPNDHDDWQKRKDDRKKQQQGFSEGGRKTVPQKL
jgi:hypothetical protein